MLVEVSEADGMPTANNWQSCRFIDASQALWPDWGDLALVRLDSRHLRLAGRALTKSNPEFHVMDDAYRSRVRKTIG